MTDKSGMALIDREEVIRTVDSKLRSGWCIVYGDSNAVIALEEQVFTPGTPANADFIAFFLPFFSLYLARKTDRLKQLFPNTEPVTEVEWKHVVAIALSGVAENGAVQATIRMLPDLSGITKVAMFAVNGGFR